MQDISKFEEYLRTILPSSSLYNDMLNKLENMQYGTSYGEFKTKESVLSYIKSCVDNLIFERIYNIISLENSTKSDDKDKLICAAIAYLMMSSETMNYQNAKVYWPFSYNMDLNLDTTERLRRAMSYIGNIIDNKVNDDIESNVNPLDNTIINNEIIKNKVKSINKVSELIDKESQNINKNVDDIKNGDGSLIIK